MSLSPGKVESDDACLDILARDPPALLASQEDHDVGDFPRGAEPAERRVLSLR
jgi:hypothetical protein